jgi:hypothetical protein
MYRRFISHGYYLLQASYRLLLGMGQAALYFKKQGIADLALPPALTLNSKSMRRLKHYFYGVNFLAVVFDTYRGAQRTATEKKRFTQLAALAYFFDDLVENFRHRDDSGILWQDNPEIYGQTADPTGMALHFLHVLYEDLGTEKAALFREQIHRVFNAETAAAAAQGSPSVAALSAGTREKGAASVLSFRYLIDDKLLSEEYLFISEFGYLIQLCDDIFDIWMDHQKGISTLPLVLMQKGAVTELVQIFENQVLVTHSACMADTRKAHRLRARTWAEVHFLVTITRVCLKHYGKLQKKHGTLPLHNRALMVVDMEKWHNRFRAAWWLVFKTTT